tara:strand:- start:2343 stop:3545 length:1203 start_codon:yes stop_codon:yes gene_type:complete
MTTVTVLMPVYNGARYLREAIDSILQQTFQDFEFLIIDDASTDESVKIVLSYHDDRIRLIQNESNLGQVKCQNKGLHLANGKYIARLDQDDSSEANRLQRQIEFLNSNNRLAVVGTWLVKVDGRGNEIGKWLGNIDDYIDVLFTSLTNSLPLYHPSVMFRRDAVLAVNGYDEDLPYCEDQDLWRRLALAGYESIVIPEVLTRYRIHDDQQSVTKSNIQSNNVIITLERFLEYFVIDSAVKPLRLLMTCESLLGLEFWELCSSPKVTRQYCDYILQLLFSMKEKLQLTSIQFEKLELLMRRHAVYASLRAWRGGLFRQWFASVPMYLFAVRGGISMTLCHYVYIYPIVYVIAPIFIILRTIKRLVFKITYVKSLFEYMRHIGKQSNVLRYWYRKIRYSNSR